MPDPPDVAWRKRAPSYYSDICRFLEDQFIIAATGSPIRLLGLQPAVLPLLFARDAAGRFHWETMLYSAIKKSGKSTIGAGVALWLALVEAGAPECFAVANDLEQSRSRSFRYVEYAVRHNPVLSPVCKIRKLPRPTIEFPDGTLEAIPSDYAGEAGSNPTLTLWDELWAYRSEAAQRLWEEMTPSPVRLNSIRFITTYAGFSDESTLLWSLYERTVLTGRRLSPDLPIWEDKGGSIVAYWDTEPRLPWQTEDWFIRQQATMRPAAYRRIMLNSWTESEGAFVAAPLWDTLPRYRKLMMPLKLRYLPCYAFVDAAHKRDCVAAVLVGYHPWLGPILLDHAIWKPSASEPVIPEDTAVPLLERWQRDWNLRYVGYDPAHFETAGIRLRRKWRGRLRVTEVPQTGDNLLLMTSALYDALVYRRLLIYTAADLREHVLNARAAESPRGWRLTKPTAGRNIDGAVALAGALAAATAQGPQDCKAGAGIYFV